MHRIQKYFRCIHLQNRFLRTCKMVYSIRFSDFLQKIRLTNLALKKISINWIFYLSISSYKAIQKKMIPWTQQTETSFKAINPVISAPSLNVSISPLLSYYKKPLAISCKVPMLWFLLFQTNLFRMKHRIHQLHFVCTCFFSFFSNSEILVIIFPQITAWHTFCYLCLN